MSHGSGRRRRQIQRRQRDRGRNCARRHGLPRLARSGVVAQPAIEIVKAIQKIRIIGERPFDRIVHGRPLYL
ncbi:MAG TPA: hypothetical protein VNG89_10700 [Vicinamibacterales bacterium]|nr:hypothetical protein [Vicinamibacterales bacterium]